MDNYSRYDLLKRAFAFDIHGVLLSVRNFNEHFREYLGEQKKNTPEIELNWDGDVGLILRGLLYKFCPLCEYQICTEVASPNELPHTYREYWAGRLSRESFKVGLTYMMTHYVSCDRRVRIILDHYITCLTSLDSVVARTSLHTPMYEIIHLLVEIVGSENLYILSNCQRESFKAYQRIYPDLFALFPEEHVFLSAEQGTSKYSTDIFEKFCAQYQLKPSEVLFFDDVAANCERAASVGIEALLYSPDAPAVKDFVAHLKEVKGSL